MESWSKLVVLSILLLNIVNKRNRWFHDAYVLKIIFNNIDEIFTPIINATYL